MLTHPVKLFFLISIPNLIKSTDITAFFFQIHRVSCALLALWVLAHMGAALHHHFIVKNAVLKRMLGKNG
jgi:cytochrome b561